MLSVVGVPHPNFSAFSKDAGICFRLHSYRVECAGRRFHLFATFHVRLHVDRLSSVVEGKVIGCAVVQRQGGTIQDPRKHIGHAGRDFFFLMLALIVFEVAFVENRLAPLVVEANVRLALAACAKDFPYSYANASIGSRCAALNAGYNAPASAPTTAISEARSAHSLLQKRSSTGFSIIIKRRVTKLMMIPPTIPAIASSTVSRSTTLTMYHFDAPIDFKIPISRVRSITAVYIDWKITKKPTTTATQITTLIARSNPGRLSGVIVDRYSGMERTEYFSIPGICKIAFST